LSPVKPFWVPAAPSARSQAGQQIMGDQTLSLADRMNGRRRACEVK
jgi:hypothetical protein